MLSILIIEDDITFSLMLKTWLGKKGFVVESASLIQEAKRKIADTKFDLIISDLRLPDDDGIDLLKWLKEKGLSIPLIIMTGYAEIQTAVQAMKLGAADYIAKPLNPDELLGKIRELLGGDEKRPVAEDRREPVRQPVSDSLYIEGLVTGASGTGKEYIARRIHEQSNRRSAPFVAVDCGAIPKDLAASEFFGHVKGSFTGAVDNKVGAFVAAQGGTIFLDEIGNLTYEVQVQLLRALQERRVKPVGSNQEIPINVRLVSATNENLRMAIDRGEFREDLYHRINEFTVRIPDLKERKEDLLLFANHFLDLANSELGKDIIGFDPDTIQLFLSYPWPGNLRQMKNVIKYATLLATGRYITRAELPEELLDVPRAANVRLKDETHEREKILQALREAGNNKTKAAQLLGIDRKTLYNKLKNYQLD